MIGTLGVLAGTAVFVAAIVWCRTQSLSPCARRLASVRERVAL
jgi:hypothetical protein